MILQTFLMNSGDNFPPPTWKMQLAQFISYAKIVVIMLLVASINFWPFLGWVTFIRAIIIRWMHKAPSHYNLRFPKFRKANFGDLQTLKLESPKFVNLQIRRLNFRVWRSENSKCNLTALLPDSWSLPRGTVGWWSRSSTLVSWSFSSPTLSKLNSCPPGHSRFL